MANMALDQISSGVQKGALIQTLYGIEKIGKTTWASRAPNPIFLAIEKGTEQLDVQRFPKPDTFSDAIAAINYLISEEHQFKTLVVDSLDAAEILAQREVVAQNEVSCLEDIGYGSGYKQADEKMLNLIDGLEVLRDVKGMQILILAHSKITTFNDPDSESHSVYEISCRDRIVSRVKYVSDCLLFANHDKIVKEHVQGLRKEHKAESTGRRKLFTQHKAAFSAGNRIGLPALIDLDGDKYWSWINKNYYGTTAPKGISTADNSSLQETK